MHKYAVVYHDIMEGGIFWFDLIDTSCDLAEACAFMFNHFDDENQQSNKCLMAGDDMECQNGLVYFVVNLDDPPKSKSDFNGLSRYYILHKEEKR